jgi:Amt family ammonium transporter
VVRAINEVGRSMRKQMIAEFVESEEILAALRDMGVDYAQGFHIGRPRPLDELSIGPIEAGTA